MQRSVRVAAASLALAAATFLAGSAAADVQGAAPQRPSAAAAKAAPLPLTAEGRAVQDLRAEGRREVDALMASLAAASNEASRRDVQRRIAQAKLGTDLKVLRYRAAQSRLKGDLSAAMQLEAIADALEHPKQADASVPQSRIKQTPDGRAP